MKQFKLLLVGLLVFAFISCDTEEIAKTTTELLTHKVWTFDMVVGNADQADLVDEFNTTWEGMTQDYRTDGTYTVVDKDGTFTGVWEIDSTEDNVTLEKGKSGEISFFIHSISETEMRHQLEFGTSGIFSVYFK